MNSREELYTSTKNIFTRGELKVLTQYDEVKWKMTFMLHLLFDIISWELRACERVATSGIKKASSLADGSVKNSKNGSKDRGSFVIQGYALAAALLTALFPAIA